MLNKATIAIAEMLAMNTTVDLQEVGSPIVKASGSLASGLIPLTNENYQEQLPLTTQSAEFTATMEELSSVLAENVRTTFNQISVYGKGLVNNIVNAFNESDAYIGDADRLAKNFLTGMLDLEFIRTDHPFFSSLLYPVKAPNLGLTFKQISADQFGKISFARWEAEQVIAWLGIDNQEINELLMSSRTDIGYALRDLSCAYELPFKFNDENKTYDFTSPLLSNIDKIFAQYIILCKMVSEDEPFEGLVSGGLNDYREHVTLLHAAYTTALIALKEQVKGLNSSPIRVVEKEPAVVRESVVIEGGKLFPRVRCKGIVYYNSVGMQKCIDAKVNFTDVAIAYLHRKYLTLEPTIANSYLSDPSSITDYMNNLCQNVQKVATEVVGKIYNKIIQDVLLDFLIAHPEINNQDIVKKEMSENNWGNDVVRAASMYKMGYGDALFDIRFPQKFLAVIGCKDAADILHRTVDLDYRTDEVGKREVLHEVVIDHLVRKIITSV